MRFEIRYSDIARSQSQLCGATAGEHIFATEVAPLMETRASAAVLILGFRGAQWVTGSFLKATWLKARVGPNGDPLPACVAHLADDVRVEFDIFCKGHGLPGLEALDWTDQGIALCKLHGHLENVSWETLELLIANPGATAPGLHALAPGRVNSPTAWTNRLNELWRLGLAVRRKDGRAWTFFPTMREVHRG